MEPSSVRRVVFDRAPADRLDATMAFLPFFVASRRRFSCCHCRAGVVLSDPMRPVCASFAVFFFCCCRGSITGSASLTSARMLAASAADARPDLGFELPGLQAKGGNAAIDRRRTASGFAHETGERRPRGWRPCIRRNKCKIPAPRIAGFRRDTVGNKRTRNPRRRPSCALPAAPSRSAGRIAACGAPHCREDDRNRQADVGGVRSDVAR